MRIEDFISYINSNIKKYRKIYKIMEIIAMALLLYAIIILLNIDKALTLIPFLKVYASYGINLNIIKLYIINILLFLFSVFCAIIITRLMHIRDNKKGVIDIVETKYPLLHERLSTAYDNRNVKNIIVADLQKDVEKDTQSIRGKDFLDKKRIKLYILTFLIAISLLLYVNINDYRIDAGSKIVDSLTPEMQRNNIDIIENSTNQALNQSEEISIGKPSVVVVEGKEVDLTLPPVSADGINQNGLNNTSMPDNFRISSAADIKIISSSTYSENLPDGYENIIRQYFEKMAQK